MRLGALLLCACAAASALPQDFGTKSVKGGHGGDGFQQNGTASLVRRFYGANNNTAASQVGQNLTRPIDFERGVCYIEVPTVQLVRDPSNVPAGNGSRPDLSRVRSCCKGYQRNIHNFKICDPVCVEDCVNGLCTAPDVCTCFPDHVRNLAGFCIPTCPIGCQNGHCAGGECLCNEGYTLDADGRFCVPLCHGKCSGLGNCTAPNSCDCKKDYRSTVEGACEPSCQSCTNGVCVGPNQCQCNPGYEKSQYGECVPSCPKGCGSAQCTAPGVCSCPLGLELDAAGQCAPKCSRPCLNGVCSPGDTCTCKPGYALDRADPTGTRCLPSCPGGCPNGVCSAPNFCICNVGYAKDRSVKGAQTCVKRL